jgi:phosphoenolpyruvate phosphomutase
VYDGMIAMILASGTGSRLMPLTKDLPKSLIKIGDKTIIDRQMESLLDCGIKKVIVTTGYKSKQLETFLRNRNYNIDIRFIRNDKFDTTNYIYSMWLSKDYVNDEVLLIHGDVVYEYTVLKKLLIASYPNSVLLNNKMIPPEKDFKAIVYNGFVRKIAVDLDRNNSFFSVPIYRFSKPGFSTWMMEIDCFINSGNINCYAEDALNLILKDIQLFPVFYDGLFCMEIDTIEDLELAKNVVNNGKLTQS